MERNKLSLLITAYLIGSVVWNKVLVCRYLLFSAQDFLSVIALLSVVQPSVEFHVETSQVLLCFVKQMTGFYMKQTLGWNGLSAV